MSNEYLQALEKVKDESLKLREKFRKKAEKERAKINDVYIIVQGEKCYTESDIFEFFEADMITSAQRDRYEEQLEKKKARAGEQKDELTMSERICQILDNTINNYYVEISDIKRRETQEKAKEERWKIAQAQGCTYAQWLEQEEVTRQSEEYEKLMGL